MRSTRTGPGRRQALAALAALALPAPAAAAAPGDGFAYAPPRGWRRQASGADTVYAALLQPEPRARHEARLFVFAPAPAPRGPAAAFEAAWRAQFGGLDRGGEVVHYRGRLPGGLNACYMGRVFERPGQGSFYGVLYAVDLGDRVQMLAATVVAGWDGVTYPGAAEDSAIKALAQALFPVLDSLRAPGREARGPLFAPAEVQGRWRYDSGGTAGSFVHAQTGASLGTAVRGARSDLVLQRDGRYRYDFAMYAVNPAAGASVAPQAEGQAGRYTLVDDVIDGRPDGGGRPLRRQVVGAGTWNAPQGPRRMLVVIAPDGDAFRRPSWVPVWDGHPGVMHWYREAS